MQIRGTDCILWDARRCGLQCTPTTLRVWTRYRTIASSYLGFPSVLLKFAFASEGSKHNYAHITLGGS
eukprot:1129917-Amphidinium_carterae.1